MTDMEDYLGRVQAIVWRASDYVSAEAIGRVQRLVDHGEPAEGLCTLAWVIVNEDLRVPADIVKDIRTHVTGLVADGFMPADLEAHIGNGAGSGSDE